MKNTILLMLLVPNVALCQVRIDANYFNTLLAQKQYERVFRECEKLWESPYGKTSHLTCYYMGKSLCGRGYTKQGLSWFSYIQEKLKVDKEFERELANAKQNCNISPVPAPGVKTVNIIINSSYTPSSPTAGRGGVTGKSGFMLGCDKDVNENYDNLKFNDSLDARVFPLNEKQAAVRKLRSFLPSKYRIDTSGRFLVISLAQNSYYQSDVAAVAKRLEFAYQFFLNKYQLTESNKLFSIYLLPNKNQLQEAAKVVHDIKISEANIGYSSVNDLSLLGIADPRKVGTLYHELFHLVIRSDIGDISPWLDEGMACLYSVYKTEADEIIGADNTWRIQHFKLLTSIKSPNDASVPTLGQLLTYNWDEYQGGVTNNLCVASINYSLSNLFALYVQERRLLDKLVHTFRYRRRFSSDPLLPGPNDKELVEIVFESKFADVEKVFYRWLEQKYNIDMFSLVGRRPYYSYADLPLQLQEEFVGIDNDLNRLMRDSSSVSKSDIRVWQQKRTELFRSVVQESGAYMEMESEHVQDLADRDDRRYGEDVRNTRWDRYIETQKTKLSTFRNNLLKLQRRN